MKEKETSSYIQINTVYDIKIPCLGDKSILHLKA